MGAEQTPRDSQSFSKQRLDDPATESLGGTPARAEGRQSDRDSRIYALILAIGVAVVCVIPTLLARWSGTGYLGFQYNTDDHMVYAAWMRQAMDGRFFFDNRFTVDPQPGLTVHVYFFVLGLISKLIGIVATLTLARALLSGLFVWLAYGLICRITPLTYVRKLALTLTVFGAGTGYLVWHNFGVAIVKPVPAPVNALMMGRLPIDVWQPEAFVFPSMLTNSLFMAALCLIVVSLAALLDAKNGRRSVVWGFCAFAVLANIHSYDVAMLGLVLVAFLAAGVFRRQVTAGWLARGAVIVAGAVGPALWIVHVLHSDPVFRSRAATETFSPPFVQVFWGLPFLILFALVGLWPSPRLEGPAAVRRKVGLGIAGATIAAMCVGSIWAGKGYWLSLPVWIALYLVMVSVLCLISDDDEAQNLMWAWALIGLTAIYVPALFQRKMAMGLVVPWAILAAVGFAQAIGRLDRGARNLLTVLAILLVSGSSFLWFTRERQLAEHDESSTTLHPVYLSSDATRIVAYLDEFVREHPNEKTVVLAMPGIPGTAAQPDGFAEPYVPDLNPILSGMAGVYTFAGHWSETPDYRRRRSELSWFYVPSLLPAGRSFDAGDFLRRTQADFIVAPLPSAFPILGPALRDMRSFGRTVVDGSQFRLIKVE